MSEHILYPLYDSSRNASCRRGIYSFSASQRINISPFLICPLFYVHYNLRVTKNRHTINSTKMLRGLFLNSLLQNLLFESCTGLFFWKKIYSCGENIFLFCVSGFWVFSEESSFHFFITKYLTNL